MKILNLVFELNNWSWGVVVKSLLEHTPKSISFNTQEFHIWKQRKTNGENIILSQNVTQLPALPDLSKVIARLGGNSSFADKRAKVYLNKMTNCYAIIATNRLLKNIATTANLNTHLILNGLDLNIWKPKKGRKWRIKKPRIGFIDNITDANKRYYKGYDYVIEACDSTNLALKEALFRDKQIPHDQMKELFWDQIDILIHPTMGEGCSNTLMEATACGIPIITTRDAGIHGELMEHEVNVLFCERSTKSIIEQLNKLISNKELFKRLHLGSRAFAEKHHDINIISQQYTQILKSCYFAQDHTIE